MRRKTLLPPFFAAVLLLFMLFFAYNNSPLIGRLGEDGSIYLVMGKALTEGAVLYVDLFDHKGPVIFLLNALPQLFGGGAAGVWVLESLFMALSLWFLLRSARLLSPDKWTVCIPLIYLILTCCVWNGGNYSEEYAGLFTVISLYIYVLWRKGEPRRLSALHAAMLGVSFALTFFMKPTTALLIAFVIAVIGVATLKAKPALAGKYALFGLLGIFIVVLPLFLYHFQQGNLYEMLYATVLHNLKYSAINIGSGWSAGVSFTLFASYGLLLFCIHLYGFFCCLAAKDSGNALFILGGSLVSALGVAVGGQPYTHYLAAVTPLTAFCCIFIFQYASEKRLAWLNRHGALSALALAGAGVLLCFATINPLALRESTVTYRADAQALYAYTENAAARGEEVFGYDNTAVWFYMNDIQPPFRYFTMQSWMARTDPSIKEKINAYVREEKPEWIVLYPFFHIEDRLPGELADSYEEVAENPSGTLYHRLP